MPTLLIKNMAEEAIRKDKKPNNLDYDSETYEEILHDVYCYGYEIGFKDACSIIDGIANKHDIIGLKRYCKETISMLSLDILIPQAIGMEQKSTDLDKNDTSTFNQQDYNMFCYSYKVGFKDVGLVVDEFANGSNISGVKKFCKERIEDY